MRRHILSPRIEYSSRWLQRKKRFDIFPKYCHCVHLTSKKNTRCCYLPLLYAYIIVLLYVLVDHPFVKEVSGFMSSIVFPQDQLGVLVRTHIEEQSRRFGASQESIRARREELRDAQLQSNLGDIDGRHYPHGVVYPQHGGGVVESSATQRMASYGVQQGSHSRSASPMVMGGGGLIAVEPPAAAVPTRDLMPPPPPASLTSSHQPPHQQHEATSVRAPHTELYYEVRSLLEESPLVLGLQNAVLRLEHQLAQLEKDHTTPHEDRLRNLEVENETLRLETQALRDHVVAQQTALWEIQQALAATQQTVAMLQQSAAATTDAVRSSAVATLPRAPSTASSTPTYVKAAEDAEAARRLEGQLLLSAALQGDEAALIGKRPNDPPPKETVCDHCFSKALCTPCSNCQSEWYCSTHCALLRRDKHRMVCDMFKSMSGGGR